MKAITLRHPWAFAVAYLDKPVENRGWDDHYCELVGLQDVLGEPVAIHGGTPPKRGNNAAWREFLDGFDAMVAMSGGRLTPAALERFQGMTNLRHEDFIVPGIVAVATVTHATRASRSPWAVPGQLHLLLSGVRALPEPVPCSGAQGFWTLPTHIEHAVRSQSERMGVAQAEPWADWLARV